MTSKYVAIVLCLFAVLAVHAGLAQDNWNGGNGNWTNAGNWSTGLPGPTDDVAIFSGGQDLVLLDTSPSIKSLTLGGADYITYSYLVDNGVAQNLTIARSLTVGVNGWLSLSGGSTVTAGADSSNAGIIEIYNGSNFQINGNFNNAASFYSGGGNTISVTGTLTNGAAFHVNNGDTVNLGTLDNSGYLYVYSGANLNMASGDVTDVVSGSYWDIEGKFTVGGVNTFFANLTSIEGTLMLGNGSTTNITPSGGTLTNSRELDIGNGTTVGVNGDLVNNGFLGTGRFVTGGNNALNISGTLTNNGAFELYGHGDVANIGTLVNNAYLIVGTGTTLNLTNQLNVTDIPSNVRYDILGAFNAGSNSAFANLTSVEGELILGNGSTTNITPNGGTLTNSRYLTIGNGTTVDINGDVVNKSWLSTGYFVGGGNNTLNISGTLTNNGEFFVYANGDVANVGTLVNNGVVYIYIGTGATLNLANQLNVTDVPDGGGYQIYGNFNAGAKSAFANLTSVEAILYLANGSTTNIMPNGGTLTNSGYFEVGNGTTVSVTGDVVNNRLLTTGYNIAGGNSALKISGTLTNYGEFFVYANGDIADVGTLVNEGNLYVGPGATLNLNTQLNVTDIPASALYQIFGTLNNATLVSPFAGLASIEGWLTLANGQTVDITPGGGVLALSNTGHLNSYNGSTINVHGDLTSTGTVEISSGATVVAEGGQVTINGGTLLGNGGVITGNVTMAGILSPGHAAQTGGALTVNGRYTQTSSGDFLLGIGGVGAGTEFDLLTVNGQAFLDGTLDISLENGYFPQGGETFTFLLTNSGVFGEFSTVNGLNIGRGEYFTVIYNPSSVELVVNGNYQPTPEPGTFLLLGSGLLSLSYRVRRRRRV